MVAEGVEAYGVVPVNFTRGNESSVQDIVADPEENAPVEYYNLQGMRILNPQPGTFVIKRQGNKVEKIIY